MGIGELFEFEKTGRADPEPGSFNRFPFRVFGCPEDRNSPDCVEWWHLVAVATSMEHGREMADRHEQKRGPGPAWKYKVEDSQVETTLSPSPVKFEDSYKGHPCTCATFCGLACRGGCGCEACQLSHSDFLSSQGN